MVWREPDLLQVPVAGGKLTVGRWGTGSRVVLASHGITANHRCFGQVADTLAASRDDLSLFAVDHRGRGGSADLPGPYGLEVHARDLLAVLDHLGADEAILVGHSMGAYVAALAAERDRDRITGLVLIDGALPIPVDLPPGADIEAVVHAVIGPALERLDLTFASPEEYLERWRAHPAVGGEHWNEVSEAYVRYDLVESGDGWRSPVVKAAVLEDGAGPLRDEAARTAIRRVTQPTTLLWAPRGLLDQAPGLLPPAVVQQATGGLAHVTTTEVEDVNHYSIVFSERGAAAVAGAIAAHLS